MKVQILGNRTAITTSLVRVIPKIEGAKTSVRQNVNIDDNIRFLSYYAPIHISAIPEILKCEHLDSLCGLIAYENEGTHDGPKKISIGDVRARFDSREKLSEFVDVIGFFARKNRKDAIICAVTKKDQSIKRRIELLAAGQWWSIDLSKPITSYSKRIKMCNIEGMGIHFRTEIELMKIANKYNSNITLTHIQTGHNVNIFNTVDLLLFAGNIKDGDVKLRAYGCDAEKAANSVIKYLNKLAKLRDRQIEDD